MVASAPRVAWAITAEREEVPNVDGELAGTLGAAAADAALPGVVEVVYGP